MLASTLSITNPPHATAVEGNLNALRITASWVSLPDTATSDSAHTKHDGLRQWRFYLNNGTDTPVTNPSVTVNSGYAPTLFTWVGAPVASFPSTKTETNLPVGATMDSGVDLRSTIPYRFTSGFDSTRTVDAAMIPRVAVGSRRSP